MKNVPDHKKPAVWLCAAAIVIVIAVGISLTAERQTEKVPTTNPSNTPAAASAGISEAACTTDADSVKISFLSQILSFKATDAVALTAPQAVAYIDETIKGSAASRRNRTWRAIISISIRLNCQRRAADIAAGFTTIHVIIKPTL